MEDMTSAELNKAFWDIVVNTAARDEEIRTIVEWIFVNDLRQTDISDVMYEKMGERLIEMYGLSEDKHASVYNKCENNMVDRVVNNVEA